MSASPLCVTHGTGCWGKRTTEGNYARCCVAAMWDEICYILSIYLIHQRYNTERLSGSEPTELDPGCCGGVSFLRMLLCPADWSLLSVASLWTSSTGIRYHVFSSWYWKTPSPRLIKWTSRLYKVTCASDPLSQPYTMDNSLNELIIENIEFTYALNYCVLAVLAFLVYDTGASANRSPLPLLLACWSSVSSSSWRWGELLRQLL